MLHRRSVSTIKHSGSRGSSGTLLALFAGRSRGTEKLGDRLGAARWAGSSPPLRSGLHLVRPTPDLTLARGQGGFGEGRLGSGDAPAHPPWRGAATAGPRLPPPVRSFVPAAAAAQALCCCGPTRQPRLSLPLLARGLLPARRGAARLPLPLPPPPAAEHRTPPLPPRRDTPRTWPRPGPPWPRVVPGPRHPAPAGAGRCDLLRHRAATGRWRRRERAQARPGRGRAAGRGRARDGVWGNERARGGRSWGGERRLRRLPSAQDGRAGTGAAEPAGTAAAAADSGHPFSSPPPPRPSPFLFLSFPGVLRGRSLSAARSRGVSAASVPAAAEGRAGPSPPQPGLRDPLLRPRLRPSPGLDVEGPAPARLPGGLGEDVGRRRRRQPGGGAAQTRRHHQPLEREPAGPVRDQRPHRGERDPPRLPPAGPLRPGPPRHPLRAAREVRHRARARPRPPPPRGPRSARPPALPPQPPAGGLGHWLPPRSPLTRGPAWPWSRLHSSAGRAGERVSGPSPCLERLGWRQVAVAGERKGARGRVPPLPQAHAGATLRDGGLQDAETPGSWRWQRGAGKGGSREANLPLPAPKPP